MKTSIFKLICTVFAVSFLFSSCLGDKENSYEVQKDFAYITTTDQGAKVAAVSNGIYITNNEIARLTEGECYFLGYKITIGNNANGIYNAQNLGSPKRLLQTPSRTETDLQIEDDFNVTRFGITAYSPDSYYNNRWAFTYQTSSLINGDFSLAYFYYDPNNQKEDGVDVGKNKIIIDVRFKKDFGGVEYDRQNVEMVVDMTDIKEFYGSSDQIDLTRANGEYLLVPIKFRYNLNGTESLDGSWSTDSGSLRYAFFYPKNK